MSESKGIVLAAFGRPGYQYWAHNLALSIKKHNPKLQIALIHDDTIGHLGPRANVFFDKKIKIDRQDYETNGKIDPAKLKCNLASYLPYDHNLYLDVDAICTQDLEPVIDSFIEKPGYYYTHIVGKGLKNGSIDYSIWATNIQIWEYFKLDKDQEAVAIQSSYAYFQKSAEAEVFYQKVKENYENFDRKKYLSVEWGGTVPDELIYSGTISQMQIDADGGTFIFFGNSGSNEKNIDNYAIISFYGNGNGNTLVKLRYWERYDKLMHQYSRETTKRFGQPYPHIFKTQHLRSCKHANGR